MKPAQLLAHFERISDAPNAIVRLREFVLDLAVRGRISERDSSDEPASDLLQRVAAEKQQLIREGAIKASKPTQPIGDDDVPFEIAPTWRWVRLAEILTKLTDGTHHSPPNGPQGAFRYITAKNIKPEGVSLAEVTFVSADVHQRIYSRCDPEVGDILYVKDGATTGVATINNIDEPFSMLSSVALLKLPSCIYNRLILEFLRSPFFYRQMRSFMKGAAITRVTLKRMEPALIPLPPLAEQHRIVAKIDELMALCDRLEEAQEERESRRDRLVAASLHRLNQHSDADAPAFREHARFHLRHLPRLTTRPELIQQLRQTIRTLAVQGRLVPQDQNDGSALDQLALIDQLRKGMAMNDRRAKERPRPLLAKEERWIVPSQWHWRALADLVLFIDYRGKTPRKVNHGVRLVTAKNVREGFVSDSPEEFISEDEYHRWMTRGLPSRGDVLFTTEAPMGNAAVIRSTERFALAQRVICLHPYGGLDPDFLALQLISQPFQSILNMTATGLTAKGIKGAKLKCLPIAFPPLAEQERIAGKARKLLALCDELKDQLSSAEVDRRRLLRAVLYEALAPASEKRA